MVQNSYKTRQGRSPVYVVDDPDNELIGTDLWPEDCDEDDVDAKVDWTQGFNPVNPVYMATTVNGEPTGEFFRENPDVEPENYEEEDPDEDGEHEGGGARPDGEGGGER